MYQRFSNRLIINAELITVTSLHIGAGQGSFKPSTVKAPLLKDAFGQPYIPGSSIKGVLRSFLESLDLNNAKSCYMGERCSKPFENGTLRKEHINKIKKISHGNIDAYAAEDMAAKACMACRLFGSKVMAGKVKISDAVLNSDHILKTEIRTGNAIDRDTHTAAGSALFDIETIPSGTNFILRIVGENLTKKESIIFSKLIQYFGEGELLLGGHHRSGLGQICLQNVHIDIAKRQVGEFPEHKKVVIEDITDIAAIIEELMGDAYANEPEVRITC